MLATKYLGREAIYVNSKRVDNTDLKQKFVTRFNIAVLPETRLFFGLRISACADAEQ